jgi:hypothetical protein
VPRFHLREAAVAALAAYVLAAYVWALPSWLHVLAVIAFALTWLHRFIVAPIIRAIHRAADDHWG